MKANLKFSPAAETGDALLPSKQPGGDFALRRDASLLPAASIAGRSLVTVIAIMSFLGALAAGSGLLVAGASQEWRRAVASEVTIQVTPVPGRDIDAEVDKAVSLARATPGVASVDAFDKERSEKLLEPWLGTGLNLSELPVPRMIAVKLDSGGQPDLPALRQRLSETVAGASLDDHQIWFAWLATMADTVVAITALIFGLVLVAMFLTVAFTTRGAMVGNHEIIGVLHFVGAEDRYIAREFQSHFLRLGLRGGIIGGGGAILAFALAGLVAAHLQATPGGDQLEALFGSFSLGLKGYAAIVTISLAIAVATGLMSRIIVYRQLQALE